MKDLMWVDEMYGVKLLNPEEIAKVSAHMNQKNLPLFSNRALKTLSTRGLKRAKEVIAYLSAADFSVIDICNLLHAEHPEIPFDWQASKGRHKFSVIINSGTADEKVIWDGDSLT